MERNTAIIVSLKFTDHRALAAIDRAAKRLGMSRSAFLRQAARLHVREIRKTGKARVAA